MDCRRRSRPRRRAALAARATRGSGRARSQEPLPRAGANFSSRKSPRSPATEGMHPDSLLESPFHGVVLPAMERSGWAVAKPDCDARHGAEPIHFHSDLYRRAAVEWLPRKIAARAASSWRNSGVHRPAHEVRAANGRDAVRRPVRRAVAIAAGVLVGLLAAEGLARLVETNPRSTGTPRALGDASRARSTASCCGTCTSPAPATTTSRAPGMTRTHSRSVGLGDSIMYGVGQDKGADVSRAGAALAGRGAYGAADRRHQSRRARLQHAAGRRRGSPGTRRLPRAESRPGRILDRRYAPLSGRRRIRRRRRRHVRRRTPGRTRAPAAGRGSTTISSSTSRLYELLTCAAVAYDRRAVAARDGRGWRGRWSR